jgi:hypothetical protein
MYRKKGYVRGRTMNKSSRKTRVRILSTDIAKPHLTIGNSSKISPYYEIMCAEKYKITKPTKYSGVISNKLAMIKHKKIIAYELKKDLF